MPTPNPISWLPDDDDLFLWESNAFGLGGIPQLLDNSNYRYSPIIHGSPGVVAGVTGNGRSFPGGGTAFYKIESSGWVNLIRATKQMNVDVMFQIASMTGTPAGLGVFTGNHVGSDNGFYWFLDADGTCEMRFHADGGAGAPVGNPPGYYDMFGVVVPGIPGPNYVHFRGTCDWAAQEIKFWAGVPGTPLTLLRTLTTPAGLNFYNATDVWSDVGMGAGWPSAFSLNVDKVRVSRVVRTDSFPNPFGAKSSAFNQGFN